jgi:tetratricopeptide (TPR) repeat protein
MSNKGLASRVRTEARRRGVDASPDHVSVKRWLDGTRPHDDTIRCIAAVLSAKLGREVSFAELGYQLRPKSAQDDVVEDGARYPADPARAVTLLDNLTGADMADSPDVMKAGWVSETAPAVITGYLFSAPMWQGDQGPLTAASAAAAERIRVFTHHLMDLDFRYGGGHVRRTLLFYFRSEIVPLLREPHPDQIRRAIFGAAAEVAQLLGWSAYDAGRHGAAQRYFMQGLRLAQEAEDPMLGGRLLSNLSHQANYLGRYNEALQFARAAQAATVGKATPTVNAMFLAMEARALASSGDSRLCAQVLHRAEQAFAQRDPGKDPHWIGYFDALELAGEAAHCFRELGRPNETQLFATQAIDPLNTPPRTQAFISMVAAAGAFKAGNLDEALSLATDAVGLTSSLQSSRYVRYLTDFHQSLVEKHSSNPAVRRFAELLSRTYPTPRLRAAV